METMKKKVGRLPYGYYFYPVLILTTLGVFDSLYLILSHYRNFTDLTYSSVCAISKSLNCDTVSQSPWSILFGLPMGFWGVFGYLSFAVFLWRLRRGSNQVFLWSFLLLLATLYSLFSVYLGYISATRIQSYCLMCLISYLINFLLMFYCWIIWRRFESDTVAASLGASMKFIKKDLFTRLSLIVLLTVMVLAKVLIPHYWEFNFPTVSGETASGLTAEGHPWIGAENAELTIVEFSDYQCFQCFKMHYTLRSLIEERPGKIKLIHRHYPLDSKFNSIVVPEPFHEGSGKMALMAIYAAAQGKFWEANDMLFKLGRTKQAFNTRQLAKATGIPPGEYVAALKHPAIRQLLQNDIREGMKLTITGTPTFIIDGHPYQGVIPEDILSGILQ